VSHAGVGSPPPTLLSSKNLIDPPRVSFRGCDGHHIRRGAGAFETTYSVLQCIQRRAYNDENKYLYLEVAKIYLAVTLYDRLTMVSSG
jgi:hypothetical protein